MGRKPRVEFKGAIYHVIKRGNNRDYIFQEREDKESLLRYIAYAKEDGRFNLMGYVIMDNHYHLIIQTQDKPLNKIMKTINIATVRTTTKGITDQIMFLGEDTRGSWCLMTNISFRCFAIFIIIRCGQKYVKTLSTTNGAVTIITGKTSMGWWM